jgi:subtilisin family serine protease
LLRVAPLLLAALVTLLAASPAAARTRTDPPRMIEVVVTLKAPPLAAFAGTGRSLYAHRNRLDLRAPASVSYLTRLATKQRQVAARITAAVPQAFVRWRYQVVVDGFALVVPDDETARVARLPGVAKLYPSLTYRPTLDRSPQQIGAPALWGPGLATAGHGVKIGILDDGIDQTHPFFDPTGFTMPAGFPKGQRSYTTAKVIVARAFAPAYISYKGARLPFDPSLSFHGTHVAGIAAGDPQTVARGFTGSPRLNGIAPEAYLGNYKVLGVPTPQFGADGNSPEIVAGIEAAVRDGMDVLNMSFGEPEVAPNRDIVVRAVDAAAKAGVVSAISAGNDFDEFGNGTISSPANAPAAITAAAVTTSRSGTPDVIGDFSSAGPTPVSLKLKPDVSSPGVNILSAQPHGRWAIFSGTSMAAPHVAGAAALLRERHPTWTVAQIKSALVLTGDPAFTDQNRSAEASTMREGGGVIDLPKADDPMLFATPADLSFGLLRRGRSASRKVTLADAGGGAGAWAAAVAQQSRDPGVTVTVPASVTVPGTFTVRAAVGPRAVERDVTGFVVLSRGMVRRRIPYWFRVEAPRLAGEAHRVLRRPGTYRDDARRGPSRVVSYRYPDDPSALDLPTQLRGPEVVYRVRITRPVANFGVAVVDQASGSRVMPRIVVAGDENRLVGETALPLDLNPYLDSFQNVDPVAGVVLPAVGSYDVVFDTPSRARAGRFRFRFWLNDTKPPTVRLLRRRASRPLVLAVADRGSGVDPRLMSFKIDGRTRPFAWDPAHGRVDVTLTGLAAGTHRLVATVSDYQEAKNMEDVHRILPNTRVLRATFKVS